ncbi:MAG: PC4/YdbC family ssDNA-binding protein [Eubacteriaceae bacterium]|nr:PC4/YdbC family ssDNA-binding protein [Eubacteriaceae bacterium]
MNEITFEIKEQLGTINKYESGWNKEVNIVSWTKGEAQLDIREWDSSHNHMTRGLTLYEDEAKTLYKILKEKYGNAEGEQ